MFINSSAALLINAFRIEFRKLHHVFGLLVFAWIVAYIISRIHPSFNERHFNFIFWTFTLLFSISICLRSVGHYSNQERLLLYAHVSPHQYYFSSLVFNFLYLLIVSLFFYGVLIILISPSPIYHFRFLLLIVMSSFVLSAILSFISTLSQGVEAQHTLMSILSIPALIPVILLLNNIGLSVILSQTLSSNSYVALMGISLLTISLSIVLFPYTWKE